MPGVENTGLSAVALVFTVLVTKNGKFCAKFVMML